MPSPIYRPETDPDLKGKTPDILVVEALQDGPRTRRQVRAALLKGPAVWSKYDGKPRRSSTLDEWIDSVVEYGFVHSDALTLRLSKVGEWVARSHQGTISQRIAFGRDVVCGECRRSRDRIVLVKCDLKYANKDGSFRVDGVCPECGHRRGSTPESPEWCNISTDLFSGYDEFDCMYQVAKKELGISSR